MIISNNKLLRIITFGAPWVRSIGLYPFIFIQEKSVKDTIIINHEKIHLRQQIELLILPFYIIYGLHYLKNRLSYMDHITAYKNIVFEREAYDEQKNLNYLSTRKIFSFLKWRHK